MRPLLGLVKVVLGLLALGVLVATAVWFWSGAATSLGTAVTQLAYALPAGQTLEARDVSGSLREGGHIGWLRWESADLRVEARDVTVGWALRPFLGGTLQVQQLRVAQVRIEDLRTQATTPSPPESMVLPLNVSVLFAIDALEWVTSTSVQATALSGRYVFNSCLHTLDVERMHIASGDYRLSGQLQGCGEMALNAQLDGTVQSVLPGSVVPVMVQARAQISGALAGRDAVLQLQGSLVPERLALDKKTSREAGAPVAKEAAVQATVNATLHPWHPQPLAQVQAHWQALDLAALWPNAPQTHLAGDAAVVPAAGGWQATVQATNSASGPLNHQRLPLQSVAAQLSFVDGQWSLQSLAAKGAGGRIEAQGHIKPNLSPSTGTSAGSTAWNGSARLIGINPAAVDSRLAGTALDGQLSAEHGPTGIAFDARLQSSPDLRAVKSVPVAQSRDKPEGLRLRTLQAQGVWAAPHWTFDSLLVHTQDASLQGHGALDTAGQSGSGEFTLTLPGGQAALSGSMGRTRGQGQWSLGIVDAALATRWLAGWPGAPAALAQTAFAGHGEAQGSWAGGWHDQGQSLQLQATVRVPRLEVSGGGTASAKPWRVSKLQADVSGTLPSLTLSLQGQGEAETRRMSVQAAATGGRMSGGTWQGTLTSARLTVQDSLRPGDWTAQLRDSVALYWRSDALSRLLEASAGALVLTGPVPGSALISWEPVQWSDHPPDTKGRPSQRAQWRTRGRITELPLAWLDWAGQTRMANLGLRGDLLFAGQWDAAGGSGLQLRAGLARTSGDLQVQRDASGGGWISAGVRSASVDITAQDNNLLASLRWDSAHAGTAQADVSSRLQQADGVWTWPLDAELAGSAKVQLPPVGVWSLLAPPGWRLRGTLDADATLSGTRGQPRWRGTLAANDLAVRSVVDGIDFSNGTLRAVLDGDRLDVQTLTLQGAGGASGGQLAVKGSVLWLTPPTAPAPVGVASRLRMELDATANALRVSARADRRLVVSGAISARLADSQLVIRGKLKADQALFLLPEDSPIQLGEDVVVRKPAVDVSRASAAAQTPASAPQESRAQVQPDVQLQLDLGPDFQIRGRGLATRLAGVLELRSAGRTLRPELRGTLTTERGTYKAYGQQLDVEEGLLRFVGPVDNPALDILAIRPAIAQRVGVQIVGTAQSPVVRLYAEPELAESEKLAWLVLGRSGASGGAEAAMLQQAALALLGGKGGGLSGGLTQALGLDEISVRGAANTADSTTAGGNAALGTTGATAATVMVGKRLSRDFYVTYERSLSGTLGTLSIFYDLSRRFTLRAQTGEQSAVDLIFTVPYD